MGTKEVIYVVTGAGGFIGNNIVRALCAAGKKVRCYVRNAQRAAGSLDGLDVEFIEGELADGESFKNALSGDFSFRVIHAAGIVSFKRKDKKPMMKINYEGAKTIADVSLAAAVDKFVFISSVHAVKPAKKGTVTNETEVFDNHKGIYSQTKSLATAYIYSLIGQGLPAVLLHPSGVIGPNDFGNGYLTKMIIDYTAGRLPAGVNGGYDFVDVRDVALAALSAADSDKTGCYMITGRYVTVREIFVLLHKHLGGKNIKLMLPLTLAKIALPILQLYSMVRKSEPLYNSYALYTLSSNGLYSHEKAARDLGFSPRDISESIADTAAFLQRNNRI